MDSTPTTERPVSPPFATVLLPIAVLGVALAAVFFWVGRHFLPTSLVDPVGYGLTLGSVAVAGSSVIDPQATLRARLLMAAVFAVVGGAARAIF